MYYPTFLYCLKVNYELSWFVQINTKLLAKGFLFLNNLGRPQFIVKYVLSHCPKFIWFYLLFLFSC